MIKSWFDFGIFCLLIFWDVEAGTELLGISRVYDVSRDALNVHDWFPYMYVTETIINIRNPTKMSRYLTDGIEE